MLYETGPTSKSNKILQFILREYSTINSDDEKDEKKNSVFNLVYVNLLLTKYYLFIDEMKVLFSCSLKYSSSSLYRFFGYAALISCLTKNNSTASTRFK